VAWQDETERPLGMTKIMLAALAMLTLSTLADAYTPRIFRSSSQEMKLHGPEVYCCATPLPPSAVGPLSVRRAIPPHPHTNTRISSIAPWTQPASGIFLEAALHGSSEAAHESYSSAPERRHKLQLLSRLLSQANEESERSEIIQHLRNNFFETKMRHKTARSKFTVG